MAKKALEFGLQPPKGTKVAWGARAIFKPIHQNPMIDILWDRQDAFGPQEEREALVGWVKDRGLPEIERQISDHPKLFTLTREKALFKFREGDYVIEANPKASAGYLYIGAWKK